MQQELHTAPARDAGRQSDDPPPSGRQRRGGARTCCPAPRSTRASAATRGFRRVTRSRPGTIDEGEPVRRYNQIIGFATQAIAPGEHVHVHNLGMGDFAKDYAYGAGCASRPTISTDRPPSRASPPGRARGDAQLHRHPDLRELQRPRRGHGRRCVQAQSVHRLSSRSPTIPNVDGVVALTHKTGCGMAAGEPLQAAAPHARRLRAASELLARHRARPGLRGEPDRRPAAGAQA